MRDITRNPYNSIHKARLVAHDKHIDHSLEDLDWRDPLFLQALVEEVGEVARALIENTNDLYGELNDLGAVVAAWIGVIQWEMEFNRPDFTNGS